MKASFSHIGCIYGSFPHYIAMCFQQAGMGRNQMVVTRSLILPPFFLSLCLVVLLPRLPISFCPILFPEEMAQNIFIPLLPPYHYQAHLLDKPQMLLATPALCGADVGEGAPPETPHSVL